MGRRINFGCKEISEKSYMDGIKNHDVPGKADADIESDHVKAQAITQNIVQADSAEVQQDDYKTKVIKYIPTEIVTAYVTLDGIIKASSQATNAVYWVVFIFLLILTPIYIWRVTSEANQQPAWDQIIVSFFSFFIWVLALGGPFVTLSWYQPLYPALMLPIYTLIIPVIIRK